MLQNKKEKENELNQIEPIYSQFKTIFLKVSKPNCGDFLLCFFYFDTLLCKFSSMLPDTLRSLLPEQF